VVGENGQSTRFVTVTGGAVVKSIASRLLR
jgi:hypothetical protein